MSIFSEYYSQQPFEDRWAKDPTGAMEVIIPVFHTNELWHANLISIYREVPVSRLLISDGGVIDDSLEIVRKFPRVEVYDHRLYKTLGKCIAELIANVRTEWFIYLHSDVYLPAGWFDTMIRHQDRYDWFGCPMNITALINYRLDEPYRPYAGSQMGRKEAFEKGLHRIDDDFVYRQEDFVFDNIVTSAGFKSGKVEDTFHYHQLMYRKSTGFDLHVKKVHVETYPNEKERLRSNNMQIRGIVKYLNPVEPYVIFDFKAHAHSMLLSGDIEYTSFRDWIKSVNPGWLFYFNRRLWFRVNLLRFYRGLRRTAKKIVKRKNK